SCYGPPPLASQSCSSRPWRRDECTFRRTPATCTAWRPATRRMTAGSCGARTPRTMACRSSQRLRLLRFACLLFLPLPPALLLEVLFRIILEGIAAAGAADVVRLAFVRHRDLAQAAADDALRLIVGGTGKRHVLLRDADLVHLGERCLVGRLHLVAIQKAIGV